MDYKIFILIIGIALIWTTSKVDTGFIFFYSVIQDIEGPQFKFNTDLKLTKNNTEQAKMLFTKDDRFSFGEFSTMDFSSISIEFHENTVLFLHK